jgi:hypothetical protein
LGVDAREALQRIGDIAIGKLADVLRRDGVDEVLALALDVDGRIPVTTTSLTWFG